jgi:hypothetical protein
MEGCLNQDYYPPFGCKNATPEEFPVGMESDDYGGGVNAVYFGYWT